MIDLHIHSTASDGRLSPSAVVAQAARAGLTTISLTDHDTTAGLAEAHAAAGDAGIRLIDGIEITAVEDGLDVHMLGYFFDPDDEELRAFLAAQREDRIRRVREMHERLAALGCALDIAQLLDYAAQQRGKSIGRPVLADALVRAGYAVDRADAFNRFLAAGRPGFVPRRGAPVLTVIEVVTAAGGITSMAHPGLTRMDDRIPRFAAGGLHALEVRHTDHDADTEARYRQLAARLGLAVSGGSDFHADPSHHAAALGIVTFPSDDFAALEARAGAGS